MWFQYNYSHDKTHETHEKYQYFQKRDLEELDEYMHRKVELFLYIMNKNRQKDGLDKSARA